MGFGWLHTKAGLGQGLCTYLQRGVGRISFEQGGTMSIPFLHTMTVFSTAVLIFAYS
jgi:hypothetical protein